MELLIFSSVIWICPLMWAESWLWPSQDPFLSFLTCRWLYLQPAPKDRYSVSAWALHSAWPHRIENMLDNGPGSVDGAKSQRLIAKSCMRLYWMEIWLVTLVTKRWAPRGFASIRCDRPGLWLQRSRIQGGGRASDCAPITCTINLI